MQKLYFFLLIFCCVYACRKTDNGTPQNCHDCKSNCYPLDSGITGTWKLVAYSHYSIPTNPNPAWIPADPGHFVTIEFLSDSSFKYSNNYSWSEEQFDRFTIIDSVSFLIFSSHPPSGNVSYHPVIGKIQQSGEIILTYMGVDDGNLEKYNCN